VRRLPINDRDAASWLTEVLSSGLSLSRTLLVRIPDWVLGMSAVAGDSESMPARADLRTGGTGGANPCAQLAEEVVAKWPAAHVVVEMPLASPSDPYLDTVAFQTVTCGEEVYAVAETRAGATAVERALRAADPSGPYLALIAMAREAPDVGCPHSRLNSGLLRPVRLIVGAFDGEGFLLADIS
jgi:hypothetical protein